MKSLRCAVATSAATSLLLLLPLGTSSIAQASTRPAEQSFAPPSDCTVSTQGTNPALPVTYWLTCTNRPASQQWRVGLSGLRWRGGFYIQGNIVTGDGTSTVTSPPGTLDPSVTFVVVN